MPIRPLDPSTDAEACDAIVASLPEWFGLQEGIEEAAQLVRTQPGLVYERDGAVIGFLTIARPTPTIAKISWLAVHANERNRGVGTALMERLVADVTGGARLLVVETLSDREDPGPEYAATRAFYLARGFRPAAELDHRDPENPIQLMAMRL